MYIKWSPDFIEDKDSILIDSVGLGFTYGWYDLIGHC